MTTFQSEIDHLYGLLAIASQVLSSRFEHIPAPSDLEAPTPASGTRGVYFFFEPGEFRTNSPEPRIVRVGSHQSDKSTVESRIAREHAQDWGRSVFRRHIGSALIRRGDFDLGANAADRDAWAVRWYGQVNNWPAHTDPARLHPRLHALQPKVTDRIRSMSVIWVPVAERAARLELERQCIRLLSNFRRAGNPFDRPSDTWLGHFALSPKVRASGLWNHQHVAKEHEPGFLSSFEPWFRAMEA